MLNGRVIQSHVTMQSPNDLEGRRGSALRRARQSAIGAMLGMPGAWHNWWRRDRPTFNLPGMRCILEGCAEERLLCRN